jgi:hypothetical protein
MGPKYAARHDGFNETTSDDFKKSVTRYFVCWNQFDAYEHDYNFSFVPYYIDVLKTNPQVIPLHRQYSSLNDKYFPRFAEIRTPRGMGYTFNIIDDNGMFNFEQ